jgi:hypothetical protein
VRRPHATYILKVAATGCLVCAMGAWLMVLVIAEGVVLDVGQLGQAPTPAMDCYAALIIVRVCAKSKVDYEMLRLG